jgi:pimeloyl-ACP methyl ester carboxylesterase
MPTMIWFPEILEHATNFETFFKSEDNTILDYRNIWLVNPRNFGNSDHHESFELDEVAEDVKRFMDEKEISIATVGGHGYGAKVACVFGTKYMERTSGVICFEGGPMDHSYHEAWEEVKNAIIKCSEITMADASLSDINRQIDLATMHSKWRKILKQNLIESSSGYSWMFNMKDLALNVSKGHRSDLCKWRQNFGLYPGRALAMFAQESHWIYLATNTIPFYKFFPKLEGRFPSTEINFIYTDDDEKSTI